MIKKSENFNVGTKQEKDFWQIYKKVSDRRINKLARKKRNR